MDHESGWDNPAPVAQGYPDGTSAPDWSPDGALIAWEIFEQGCTGPAIIEIHRLDGSVVSDYTGELQLGAGVRITDHDNGAGGFTPATVQDSALDFTLPCAATASPATGATCVAHTSADALTPGIVKELQRMVWQLGQVRVLDGGPDGVVSTANNTLFAVQGVFVP